MDPASILVILAPHDEWTHGDVWKHPIVPCPWALDLGKGSCQHVRGRLRHTQVKQTQQVIPLRIHGVGKWT